MLKIKGIKMDKTYSGKVREVYDLGNDTLLMVATNRTSSFDRYICDVPEKGNIVHKTSAEWFNFFTQKEITRS